VVPCFSGSGIICPTSLRLSSRQSCLPQCISIQIAMPYAFVFGVFTGWIRIRTESTLNTAFMHVINNVFFLCLGFLLLR